MFGRVMANTIAAVGKIGGHYRPVVVTILSCMSPRVYPIVRSNLIRRGAPRSCVGLPQPGAGSRSGMEVIDCVNAAGFEPNLSRRMDAGGRSSALSNLFNLDQTAFSGDSEPTVDVGKGSKSIEMYSLSYVPSSRQGRKQSKCRRMESGAPEEENKRRPMHLAPRASGRPCLRIQV